MTKAEFLAELQTDIPDDAIIRGAGVLFVTGEDGNVWTRTDCRTIESVYLLSRMMRAFADGAGVPHTLVGDMATVMAGKRESEKTMIDIGAIKKMLMSEEGSDDDQ